MANRKKQKSEMLEPVETAAEVGKRLHNWAVNEMGYRPWGRHSLAQIPTPEDFKEWGVKIYYQYNLFIFKDVFLFCT